MNKPVSFLFLLFISLNVFSQASPAAVHGWHLMDQKKDGYTGISLNEAYQLLKGRPNHTVIVAVIDSGIDTLHEDLKDVLWTNPKEIPGNGIDDDHNGYIDDVHGWNFDGAPNGENLARNSHEVERVYHNWKSTFAGKKEKDIPASQKFLFSQWQRAVTIINRDYDQAMKDQTQVADFFSVLDKTNVIICRALSTTSFNLTAIRPLVQDTREMVAPAAQVWIDVLSHANDTTANSAQVLKEVGDYKANIDTRIMVKMKAPEDWRGELIHDRYTDINDRFYGNNNLKAGSGNHGTGVAGVIGAVRGNGIGIDGIADNVRIMAVRAVPGGDEHDKDVALAIRYAVDNGARVINMSFGKPVSPYKQFVDDAIRYAASKGVLLVHASGNDGADLEKENFYPSPFFLDGTRATNLITVSASGDGFTSGYAASFSNYSRNWVDIFAPGVAIYTTATNNQYESADGTSLASPVVTGVAALLRSYFPKLTPQQVIHIIDASGTPIKTDVVLPGHPNELKPFPTLSSSGRIINAYEAVKMAIAEERL
jgi:subtilisin family serine protease